MKEKEISGEELERLKKLSNPMFWKHYIPILINRDKDIYYDILSFFEFLSDIERRILWLYISGYNQKEIGNHLQIRRRKVSEIIKKIKLKFLKKIRQNSEKSTLYSRREI